MNSAINILLISAIASFTLPVSLASAGGCITGKIQYASRTGSYCDDSTRDCTGWNWRKSQVENVNLPMTNAIIHLRNSENWTDLNGNLRHDMGDTVLGATATVDNASYGGKFDLCWSGSKPDGVVAIRPWDAANRYQITYGANVVSQEYGKYIVLQQGTTQANPQNVGTIVLGTMVNPNEHVNAYGLVGQVWWTTVFASSRLFSNGFGLEIRAAATEKNESHGYDKVAHIHLSEDEMTNMGGPIPHEIGHILTALASREGYCGPDSANKGFGSGSDYTECGGAASHGFLTEECQWAAMVEGMATFLGQPASMQPTANTPCDREAGGPGPCHMTGFANLESGGTCSTTQDQTRQEIWINRAMWDYYDAGPGDGHQHTYSQIINSLFQFPNGRGQHQKSEVWSCAWWTCWVSDRDARDIFDHEFNVESLTGTDTQNILDINCM